MIRLAARGGSGTRACCAGSSAACGGRAPTSRTAWYKLPCLRGNHPAASSDGANSTLPPEADEQGGRYSWQARSRRARVSTSSGPRSAVGAHANSHRLIDIDADEGVSGAGRPRWHQVPLIG